MGLADNPRLGDYSLRYTPSEFRTWSHRPADQVARPAARSLMDPLLQGLEVDQRLVCGAVTNICVESTVRAAFMGDYRVTLLGDACAAQTPRLHEYGLPVMGETGLANVVSLAEGYQVSDPEFEPTVVAA